MAEKNYKTVAVVPEMPRTIDNQQLHIYTPVGSTGNFGVFKPDGDQFVIVNGVLRADVTKLIQLADPSAIVTENGGPVGVDIAFTEPDNTLNRKFKFTFKNIKGETGATGATGLSALQTTYTWTSASKPVIDTTSSSQFSNFNRTPVVGDTFIAVYRRLATDLKTILGVYLVYCEITSVDESSTSCNFKLVRFQEIPIKYITQITGPVTEGLNDTYTIVFSDGMTYDFVVTNGAQGATGPAGPTGEQGPKGDDGVSITSVTQTGVQGGTQVTITLSNGQSTSFIVYNGINTNFQVVNALPTENISTSTIYLVPATTPGAENVYDEYIYVNGNWEHIGSTSVDLSDYVTKTYFNQNVGDATKNYIAAQLDKVHNLYIEMYESGSVPVVGQALTLTNANFARMPVVNQYFGLLEVVNTKDKYYTVCQILSVDTTTCSAKVVAVTEVTNGTEIDSIKASIATLNTDLDGKADTSALDNKLDKVKTTTTNPQVYAKAPDGSQVMTEIKGGNGITVGAASDNKFLEVKVGDTINLAENQSLTIHESIGISAPADYVKFADHTLILDSSGNTNIAIGAATEDTYVYDTLGDNIVVDGAAVGAVVDTTNWLPINAYYEITGVPTSSTTGTLPDNTSWIYLKNYPDRLRILFNKEFYQLADNQHTTGTLVFSHVGYEGSELIIKTITITIATRGWVLKTVKPAEAANFIELRTTSGTLSDADFAKLDSDDNSYILLTYSGQKYKLLKNVTNTTDLIYSVVDNEQEYKITILLSDHTWGLQVITLENTANRVTEIKASSADEEYPSAAATYTYGQTVLTNAKSYTDTAIANAITTALNTPV